MAGIERVWRSTLGVAVAGAMALAAASPVAARDRDRDDDRDGGIGAGEIIAGAVVLGGIAAIAGAFDNDRDDRRDRRGWDDRRFRGYDRNFERRRFGREGVERAISRCVRTAERQARRWGGYRFADVTQIRDVDRTRRGFRIKGRIEVDDARRFRGRDFDRGRFTCRVGRGRPDIEFHGVRGLP